MAEKKIKVTLVKSLIGTKQSHRAIDTPAVRGMINKVSYLVKCEV